MRRFLTLQIYYYYYYYYYYHTFLNSILHKNRSVLRQICCKYIYKVTHCHRVCNCRLDKPHVLLYLWSVTTQFLMPDTSWLISFDLETHVLLYLWSVTTQFLMPDTSWLISFDLETES